MGGTRRTARRSLVIVAAVWVGVALALAVAPAGAQESDPYGGSSTTAGGTSIEASCSLSVTSGVAGDPVIATVSDVALGATVRILFGGVEVGRATAPAQGTGTQTTTTLSISFQVPEVGSGRYLVTAVGADFTVTCDGGQFEVIEVLAGGAERGGSLPRTGVYAALLIATAVALFLLGMLVQASRRRRRRARRAERQAGNHLVPPRPRITK